MSLRFQKFQGDICHRRQLTGVNRARREAALLTVKTPHRCNQDLNISSPCLVGRVHWASLWSMPSSFILEAAMSFYVDWDHNYRQEKYEDLNVGTQLNWGRAPEPERKSSNKNKPKLWLHLVGLLTNGPSLIMWCQVPEELNTDPQGPHAQGWLKWHDHASRYFMKLFKY